MGSRRLIDEKMVAPVLVCLLSSMVLLAAPSSPPIVGISAVSGIEDGSVVRIRGILVGLSIHDSGSESLILADLTDGTVVKVISMPGVRGQPSSYVKIGDELLVEGEVSASGPSTIVFTSSDDMTTTRTSEFVLTVAAVSRNWVLFDGDVVRVKGFLEKTESGTGLRLRDLSSSCSIAVLPSNLDLGQAVDSTVTLTAEVSFDDRQSALTLTPLYFAVNQ